MSNEFNQGTSNYPNVRLSASVSPDGERIMVVFPHEFIDASVAFVSDHMGRHRVLIDPTYGGKSVIGFVDADGVKHGKVEINPLPLGLAELIPGKTGVWWARQRETDLLIGTLLTDLCEEEKPRRPLAEAAPPVRQVVVKEPITIDAAITFINAWAQENGATLIVEDNSLYAEVLKRWGK